MGRVALHVYVTQLIYSMKYYFREKASSKAKLSEVVEQYGYGRGGARALRNVLGVEALGWAHAWLEAS